ncbi:hypothetical protein [Streptomyces sp. NBC_01718]|uniref:hypothetical protein n=1 Tax=Streptomyces sp. NBC_01718 TaxID=2975919 RepID=UPI00352DF1F1
MTAHPRIGSIWALRFPGTPQYDYHLRVTGVFTKDDVTYVETERLESGGLSRGRLEDVLGCAEPVGGEVLHDVDAAVTRKPDKGTEH